MQLNSLMKIMPPPETPKFRGDIDWSIVESKYKVHVPDDFKRLVSVYGSGAIDGFVWILDPISENPNVNFDKSEYFVSAYQIMRAEFPEDYPRPAYPQPGSFFPWAVTDNGETFVWIIEGKPSQWNVAIHNVDQSEEEIYNMGTTDFLVCLLNKEIRSKILPSQFPFEKSKFMSA